MGDAAVKALQRRSPVVGRRLTLLAARPIASLGPLIWFRAGRYRPPSACRAMAGRWATGGVPLR